jgi:meckelin
MLPLIRSGYSDDYYVVFVGFLWAIFASMTVRLLSEVYLQCAYDVFFIDWEKPRGALARHGDDVENRGGKDAGKGAKAAALESPKQSSVSVWRKIFAVNEWAEMATQRRTNPLGTFIALVAILEGAGGRYVATPQPSVSNISADTINPVLQLAISIFWFWILVLIQLFYELVINERYINENPSARFLDLCTLMKISVLVMDEKYRGYYVHGNSPHEYADGSMAEVALNLFEEGAAMRTGRGLLGSPDETCQSFEVHVPLQWREQFDRVYTTLVERDDSGPGSRGPASAASTVFNTLSSAAALSTLGAGVERTRRLVGAHYALTNFLQGFIQESEPDFKRVWRERTIAHSLLDFPPDMIREGAATNIGMVASGISRGERSVAYMFTDPHMRFERASFLGIELDLLCFESILFCVIDYYLGSKPSISAAITLAIYFAIKFLRERYGRENLAKKTLVDSAFLS